MGTALFDAEDYLKSIKYKFTPAEEDVIVKCKGKALRDFSLAVVIASAAVWRATRRIGFGNRFNLSGGAGICAGFYVFGKSLNLSTEKILSLEDSRLQSEFAKRLVMKYGDNPRTVQMLEKYFYRENVYDDSNVDRTIARWRHRSFFGENYALGQKKHDDTYGADTDSEPKQVVEPTSEQKQVIDPTRAPAKPLKSSIEVSTDPFDSLFGHSETLEEKTQPQITPEAPPKRRTRSHRKTARKHRKRHSEHSQTDSE
ncbi:hypothetical protein MKW92_007119 [Papaver armeniacum]|nr:hypothetical protein MKW92_007119 [Papaver armeniacum]